VRGILKSQISNLKSADSQRGSKRSHFPSGILNPSGTEMPAGYNSSR